MGLLSRLFGGEYRSTVRTGSPRDPVIAEWWGQSGQTASGMSVTPDTAMRITAVYACVRALAEPIAGLPLHVYRRTAAGKERAVDHPIYDLLHAAPNANQTSFEWREEMIAHTALRGNSYAEIISDNAGRVVALEPLPPDQVRTFRTPKGRIAYRYQPPSGETRTLLDGEVLRLPGLSLNGIDGLSPIAYHRETLGVAIASREYLARFYGNSAAPKGAIELPEKLSDTAAKLLRADFERRHQGVENAHKIAIFDGGMKWTPIGISMEDAQYLELQQFSVADIARIFRVPPHVIGDLSKATFSNIEHQTLDFLVQTLMAWVRRFEDRLNRSLLSTEDRRDYYIGLDLKGLMRGDSAARSTYFRERFMVGSMSANDIRRAEDEDEIDGGDVYYVPLNMAPADQALAILMKNGASAPPPAKGA